MKNTLEGIIIPIRFLSEKPISGPDKVKQPSRTAKRKKDKKLMTG